MAGRSPISVFRYGDWSQISDTVPEVLLLVRIRTHDVIDPLDLLDICSLARILINLRTHLIR